MERTRKKFPKWWRKLLLKETGKLVVLVLAGIVVIVLIEQAYFYALDKYLTFLDITRQDWNTVLGIWTAEVPLAFLLKYLLGGYASQGFERVGAYLDAVKTAFEYNGIKSTTHLRYLEIEEKGQPQFIVNTDTHKRFKADELMAALALVRAVKTHPFPTLDACNRYCDEEKPPIQKADTEYQIEDLMPTKVVSE